SSRTRSAYNSLLCLPIVASFIYEFFTIHSGLVYQSEFTRGLTDLNGRLSFHGLEFGSYGLGDFSPIFLGNAAPSVWDLDHVFGSSGAESS
ncbi:24993_t:CDS:1, partial [Gigaspora rosea]